MAQEIVNIINVKRSKTSGKTFESSIYIKLWEKNEAKLKSEGWLLKSDIESIEIIKVEDGLGLEEIEVVEAPEAEEEEEVIVPESKPLEELTLDELKEMCKMRGIKFHHASKEAKLIELLKA
jgi:hypothetical protein